MDVRLSHLIKVYVMLYKNSRIANAAATGTERTDESCVD